MAAFVHSFASHLPERSVANDEIGALFDCTPEWVMRSCGIERRRWAAEGETVGALALPACQESLRRAGLAATEVRHVLFASGSAGMEKLFPGPAAGLAKALGATGALVIDLQHASAGSLVALHLARKLAMDGPVLVVASEIMSRAILREPRNKNTGILFGDAAASCVVTAEPMGESPLAIRDSLLLTDGAFAGDLELPAVGPLAMNGLTVIMQATRKLPAMVRQILERNGLGIGDVRKLLLHQANQNLSDKVASTLGLAPEQVPSVLADTGNTSSAGLLLVTSRQDLAACSPCVMASFGAGFTYGAILLE